MWKTTTRFDPDALGDQERAWQGRWFVLGMVLCIALGLGTVFVMPWGRSGLGDTAGAPLQSATGRITRVSYFQEVDEHGSAFQLNRLAVDGRELEVRDAGFSQELKKGQRVRFTYRQGKSGQWYLQSIQPE